MPNKSQPKAKGRKPLKQLAKAVNKEKAVERSATSGVMKALRNILPKGSLTSAGSALGSMYGPTGALVGSTLGKLAARITGAGDYVTNASDVYMNSLFGKCDPGVPQMHSNRHKTRITHSEYIQDIISASSGTPSNFNINSYSINPGLQACFPWLSTIAQNFETYKFLGLAFEYRSTSGESVASTNTALGAVVLATSYNAATANFSSKIQMENYEGAISEKPSRNIMYGVECAPGMNVDNHLYVRGNVVPSGQDQRLYDLGNFQVATVGQSANSVNLGELWVTYDVELYEPKLYGSQLGYGINFFHYVASAGVSTSNYFGSNGAVESSSNFSATLGANTITLPSNIVQGEYVLVYIVTQASGAGAGPAIAPTTNCTFNNLVNGDSSNGFASASAVTPTLGTVFNFSVTGPSAKITLSGGTLGTVTYMDLLIYQVNGGSN